MKGGSDLYKRGGTKITRKILDLYNRGGIPTLLIGGWLYLVYYGPLYELIEQTFGERLHEKLIRTPQIGYWPQIIKPRSYNEHTLHRKLFTDEEVYKTVADKKAVREYVRKRIDDDILNEVYHVTRDPKTIPFDELPDKFVIKATHGSGWNLLIEDKDEADFRKIISKCNNWINNKFGDRRREYWYDEIPPRLIVENYIESDDGGVPLDYKFFVFDGQVEYVQVDFNRFTDHKRRYFDRNWNPKELTQDASLGPVIEEPEQLDKMIEIAEILGKEFDFIRVDLYQPTPNNIVFGEITVADGSGGNKFIPKRYDFIFGSHCHHTNN